MSDLKSRSELVEDIKKSFEDTVRQTDEMRDRSTAYVNLIGSFTGQLCRCITRLKEAEAQETSVVSDIAVVLRQALEKK